MAIYEKFWYGVVLPGGRHHTNCLCKGGTNVTTRTRSQVIAFRITAAERRQINAKIRKSGLSQREYLLQDKVAETMGSFMKDSSGFLEVSFLFLCADAHFVFLLVGLRPL